MIKNFDESKLKSKTDFNRFQFRHLTVLFIVLILFQIILSFVQKSAIEGFLEKNQSWYQEDSAVQLANLTTTSLEHAFEMIRSEDKLSVDDETFYQQVLNKILAQQLLQKNVQKVCLILVRGESLYAIDEGQQLLNYLAGEHVEKNADLDDYTDALTYFIMYRDQIRQTERIVSFTETDDRYHTLVPFSPNGEMIGVLYMSNTPDFSFITDEIISSFDEVTIIYFSLILLGLLAMYYISSYTVKERNETQKDWFEQRHNYLMEKMAHEKESLFTKRIYHTHHKAEKTIGFIKEDIRSLSENNIDEVKKRVTSYSNFISRIIYDMKWYDPPMNTIINPLFKTNINDVLQFMVDNIFLRISSTNEMFEINLELDENIPIVNVNEFVVWEIFEPIIQNSIDHGGEDKIFISLKTNYDKNSNKTVVTISDNGTGIDEELLKQNRKGVKNIFLENESTKKIANRNSGYGCYIAYQLAVTKCNWKLDVENLVERGCKFSITI